MYEIDLFTIFNTLITTTTWLNSRKKKKKPNCEKKELDMYTPLVQKGILMDIQRCCKECLCLKKKKSLLDMQCFQNILEHNKSWGEIQE